jgi:multidrug efflux pump
MTPARCALIMKPHHHHGPREAPLPNWAMPLVGVLVGWLFFGPLVAGISPQVAPWGKALAGAIGLVAGIALVKPTNAALLVFFKWFNVVIGKAMDGYATLVGWLVRRALVFAVIYVLLLAFTGWGFSRLPTGFIPEQDKGYLLMAAQMPEGASLGRTDTFVRKLDELARQDPAVDHVLALPGFSMLASANVSEAGALFVILKPFEERGKHHDWNAPETQKRLSAKVAGELDGLALVFGSPPVDGLGSTGGFKLQVEDMTGVGPEALAQAVRDMEKASLAEPKLAGLMSTFSNSQPQYFLEFDRDKARTSRVSLDNIFSALSTYLGGMYVNDITLYGRNWQVNVQADAKFRLHKEDLRLLQVRNAAGKMIPLGTFLTVVDDSGPAIASRYNLRSAASLNGAAAPGVSSGEVMATVERLAKNNLGGSMAIEWTELSLLERLAAQDWINILIFPLGVIFVYLALAAQYESYTLPLAILLIVPMCLLSAWVGLVSSGLANDLFVQIGLVVLVALAAKNAILIVEFAKQLEDTGKSRNEAVVEACKMRLRPILMTSLAFILGVVPLVFSHGAGAEMRRAIGITVFSGMLGVTFFGLLFTPVFYVLVRRFLGGETKQPPLANPSDPSPPQTIH